MDEHVPEAERKIRAVKELTQEVQHTLPFKNIPEKMIISMVKFSVFWLNPPPVSSGVGGDLSTTTIITGCTINFEMHCKLEYGVYA